MHDFDLIIIGGGAGAFSAAIRANELQAKTAIINAGLPIGGTCVNVGCVPSKKLLWAGEILHQARHHGIPGVELEVGRFDFQEVMRDTHALVARLRKEKYEDVLNSLEHVTAIEGRAAFISDTQVEVNGQRLTAGRFIVATGSTATVPPIAGIDEVGFATHVEALRMDRLPKELVVIGAGPVGLELAQMFARFGTRVTVLQRGPTVLRQAEKPLSDRLTQVLQEEGVAIVTGAQVTRAYRQDDRKIVAFSVDGEKRTVSADEILLAAGKTANTQALYLEVAGVGVDDRGAVVVAESFQTANPAIYAVGDVTSAPARYETTAGREGTLAAENALAGTTLSIDYDTVPFTVFTDPQIAGVGIGQSRQVKEQGTCNCRTVSFEAVPRAVITRRTEGLIHMAVDTQSPRIVGMQILAPNAGELIATAMAIVKNGNTIDEVIDSLPMYPTLAEAIKLAALSFTKDISKLSCCI